MTTAKEPHYPFTPALNLDHKASSLPDPILEELKLIRWALVTLATHFTQQTPPSPFNPDAPIDTSVDYSSSSPKPYTNETEEELAARDDVYYDEG